MILCISVLSVVISPFSFLILLIWFFSLSFLMTLVNGLPIFFIFSKNQLLALLIFAMVSFVSFSFISALIFMIYFLLLTLGFFISSFSSCFRYRVRLFIWIFSCFLRCACIAMSLHHNTAFTVSHRFWVVLLSFSFISMHILISSVICWLFRSMLFSLHMFVFLIVFLSCSWHLFLLHCYQKRCLRWFQFFWIYQAIFMAQEGEIHCFRVKCPIDIN